jgi:hypothetical protein
MTPTICRMCGGPIREPSPRNVNVCAPCDGKQTFQRGDKPLECEHATPQYSVEPNQIPIPKGHSQGSDADTKGNSYDRKRRHR